jgi:hypothetical protein
MGNAENDWQKTDPDLRAHPRFAELCELLGVPPLVADGLLSGVWRMAYRQAPDGDLSRFSAAAICAGAGWDRRHAPAEEVIAALHTTGFLYGSVETGDLGITAWDEWGGAAMAQRRRWAAEKAAARAAKAPATSAGHPEDVQQMSEGVIARKTETKRKSSLKSIREFDADFPPWWEAYGKVGSRADALLLYVHWRSQEASREDMLAAARNYRAWCQSTNTLQKHGATFLAKNPNRWEEWVKPDLAPAAHLPSDPLTSDRRATCFICEGEVAPEAQADETQSELTDRGWAHSACLRGAQ